VANNAFVRTEPALPQTVTDDNDTITTWLIFFGAKVPPEQRLHSQQREESR
jgi:hypothetical protein